MRPADIGRENARPVKGWRLALELLIRTVFLYLAGRFVILVFAKVNGMAVDRPVWLLILGFWLLMVGGQLKRHREGEDIKAGDPGPDVWEQADKVRTIVLIVFSLALLALLLFR